MYPIGSPTSVARSDSMSDDELDAQEDRRKHKCEICGRGFDRPSSLRNHQPTHTGERAFRCDVCKTKSFTTSSNLLRHRKKCLLTPSRGTVIDTSIELHHASTRPHRPHQQSSPPYDEGGVSFQRQTAMGRGDLQSPAEVGFSPHSLNGPQDFRRTSPVDWAPNGAVVSAGPHPEYPSTNPNPARVPPFSQRQLVSPYDIHPSGSSTYDAPSQAVHAYRPGNAEYASSQASPYANAHQGHRLTFMHHGIAPAGQHRGDHGYDSVAGARLYSAPGMANSPSASAYQHGPASVIPSSSRSYGYPDENGYASAANSHNARPIGRGYGAPPYPGSALR